MSNLVLSNKLGIPQGRFIEFEAYLRPTRTTYGIAIISRKTGEYEGGIRWKGRRGYSLFSDSEHPFGPICLGDVLRVVEHMNKMHAEYKRAKIYAEELLP